MIINSKCLCGQRKMSWFWQNRNIYQMIGIPLHYHSTPTSALLPTSTASATTKTISLIAISTIISMQPNTINQFSVENFLKLLLFFYRKTISAYKKKKIISGRNKQSLMSFCVHLRCPSFWFLTKTLCFHQSWTREEKNHCLEETEKSFKFSGDILRLILSWCANSAAGCLLL